MTENTPARWVEAALPGLSPSLTQLVTARMDRFFDSLAARGRGYDPTQLPAEDLVRVMLFSQFIADSLAGDPDLFFDLVDSGDLTAPHDAEWYANRVMHQNSGSDPGGFQSSLHRFKHREIIRIAWRDLTDRAGLTDTLSDLSALARACIHQGVSVLHDQLCGTYGVPMDRHGRPIRMIVLGMGKLGAGELNFSSDIDLIFVFPEEGHTRLPDGRTGTDHTAFFTRLCKRFLLLFSAGQGRHFYRVDTRLRPFGESGPLVMSADAFVDYYQTHGREWERYAMIKAAPVAGDMGAGRDLLSRLNPFIYRRYFDYGSFDSFREMKQRITLQVTHARWKHNIKLGAGGIREIEFFGQLFQLIRGGVEPVFQAPGILQVLALLADHDCISPPVKEDLTQAYRFLRRVENRLQMYQDFQTHDIPEDPDQQEILALSMGFDTVDAFTSRLNHVLSTVHTHFSLLLTGETEENKDRTAQHLKEMWININDPQFSVDAIEVAGFDDPGRVTGILRSLATHPNTLRLTPVGRKKLARLIPRLLTQVGQADDPESVLTRLVDLVITIERRTTYLSLLIERPAALETLVTLAQKSPWIISFLSSHPVLLDELLHRDTLYAPPKKAALEREMRLRVSTIDPHDIERLLEELNIFHQVNTLRVAAADISGGYPLMKVSDHLTYIAETVLCQVLRITWQIVTEKYGSPPDVGGVNTAADCIDHCGFCIVAYGKVGGLEMGYKSDLDLVFLYRGEPGYTQGTDRPIETVRFYATLGRRIIHALTLHTPAGTLYGADMRLRPGGASGMIVSHIDAFEEYLETQAWTWEHQALIRARPIAGDLDLMNRFSRIRERVLCRERPKPTLAASVSEMRERMRKKRLVPEPGRFDLKQDRGGIVDIEFLVQYLTLTYAAEYPDITVWTDNIRLLEGLSCEGLISGEESEVLQRAYVDMRKAIHRKTLQEKKPVVSDTRFREMAAAVWRIYEIRLSEGMESV